MTKGRIRNLEFHIQGNDYFGTLATILDLLRQDINSSPKIFDDTLIHMVDDLIYLQANYLVIPKPNRNKE
jgi:hypothetical protein